MNIIERHLRVAIYIRVSTKLQEDKYSLSAQKAELTAYAEKMSWTVVDVFQDVDSGGKLDKIGLENLLDCVEDGLVDVVLVIEQDRLSRLDTVDWEYLKDILRRNNVKIAEPGSMIDLTNEDDEFISDIKNVIAKRERRSIKRKTNRGIRQYTREGKIYGKQPDEYVYDSNTKSVTVNEERAWVIPYIDRLYLEEGYGFHRIAQALNKLSATASGAKWTSVQVRKRLSNKAYHGVLERKFLNGETVTLENVYPPLRTKETWEKIQIKLEDNSATFPSVSYNHTLRRIKLTCSVCGTSLALIKGNPDAQNEFNVYISHTSYFYAKDCIASQYINADQVIRPLFQLVKTLLLDTNSIADYFETYTAESANLELLEKECALLQSKIDANTTKLDRLLELYLDGSWSSEKLNENKEKIESESKELSETLTQNLRKIELIKRDRYNIESYLEVVGNVEEYLAVFARMDINNELLPNELDELAREKLVAKLFDSIEIDSLSFKAVAYGKSLENVPMPFKFDLDEQNLIAVEKLRRKRLERYRNTQHLIDSQEEPISFMELKRLSGLNAQTLNSDAALFGPYKNLKLKKYSPEKKARAVEIIKQCIAENPKMSTVEMAKRAGVNANTVQKYIREFELRPVRGPRGKYKK